MKNDKQTLLTCPACQHRGNISIFQTHGKWGCVRCYGAADCSSCGKKLAKGALHDLCRSCRYPPIPEKRCTACDKVVSKHNKTGVCRTCRCGLNRTGSTNNRRLAKLADSNRDPILIAKRLAAFKPTPPIRRPVVDMLTKHERDLERVRQGAGIREVVPVRRGDYPYTLGGVGSQLL